MIKEIKGNENFPLSKLSKSQRIEQAAVHYGHFLAALGFDWENDPNMKDTPIRVASSWIEELVSGCFNPLPKVSDFPAPNYGGMVVQTMIPVKSMCSHHNLPISGFAHVAYLPNPKSTTNGVLGLSKLNRIVEWYSRRLQLQETLTQQILDKISELTPENRGVGVIIQARHFCTCHRGVNHDSLMSTMAVSGEFEVNDAGCKDEFLQHISMNQRLAL